MTENTSFFIFKKQQDENFRQFLKFLDEVKKETGCGSILAGADSNLVTLFLLRPFLDLQALARGKIFVVGRNFSRLYFIHREQKMRL